MCGDPRGQPETDWPIGSFFGTPGGRRIPNVRIPVLFRLKRVSVNTSLSASRLNGRIKLRMPCMLRFITVGRAVFTEFVEAALLKMILFQLLLHA